MIRKITGRQLPHLPVIMKAVTTGALPAAGIGTIAEFTIRFFFAIHIYQFNSFFFNSSSVK
jgi:hypothetical protein